MAERQREIIQGTEKGPKKKHTQKAWHTDQLKDGYLSDWWSLSAFFPPNIDIFEKSLGQK